MSAPAQAFVPAPNLVEGSRLLSQWANEKLGIARLGNDVAVGHRFSLLFEAQRRAGETENDFARRLATSETSTELWGSAANLVPNHETSFFRDVEQLSGFISRALPSLLERRRAGHPLRVLSAGCASGEEVYSLAMLLLDSLHLLWGDSIELVGIDVSPRAIGAARAGRFSSATIARAGDGPSRWAHRFFRGQPGEIVARPWLRAPTQFEIVNLLDANAMDRLGSFDAVLCRNVLIYFGDEAIDRALGLLWSHIRPHGALVLGRAESALGARLSSARGCPGGLWFRREASS